MAVASSASAITLPGATSAVMPSTLPAAMPACSIEVGLARCQGAFDPRRRRDDPAALDAAQVVVRPV